MFGTKVFSTGDSQWGGTTTTCTFFADDLGENLDRLDLQLTVDALNGDTWTVSAFLEGSDEVRVYNDNGGVGFDGDGIVLVDSAMVIGLRVILTGAAATAPAVVVNYRTRGL